MGDPSYMRPMIIVSVGLRRESTTIVLGALLLLVGPGIDSCVTA